MLRAWSVFSNVREPSYPLSSASGQRTLRYCRRSRVSHYHCRSQNSGDVDDVVALPIGVGGPHQMQVRERQSFICPQVISIVPLHFLNEHLLVFFVTVAPCRQSDLCGSYSRSTNVLPLGFVPNKQIFSLGVIGSLIKF